MARITFDDFDPNALDNGFTLWACWTGRTFRTFSTRAGALTCFSSHWKVKLYEYAPGLGDSSGRWLERACKNPSTVSDVCDRCGLPGVKDSWRFDDGSFQWVRKGGKITSPPELLHVCRSCAGSVRNG